MKNKNLKLTEYFSHPQNRLPGLQSVQEVYTFAVLQWQNIGEEEDPKKSLIPLQIGKEMKKKDETKFFTHYPNKITMILGFTYGEMPKISL